MPFIPKNDRPIVLERFKYTKKADNFTPGERCYIIFESLLKNWKCNTSWTEWMTNKKIHREYFSKLKGWKDDLEEAIIYFRKYYIDKYEEEKRRENGDI